MFEVNSYFDGRVRSIAFQGEELPSTVGVMAAGDYQFETSKHEVMSVISGALTVKLPDSQAWRRFGAGTSFEVVAGASFELKVEQETAYLCTYR